MTTTTEAYLAQVYNILDLLGQDTPIDPPSSSPVQTPVDPSSSPLLQKVDLALQRVVHKVSLLENELAQLRRERLYTNHLDQPAITHLLATDLSITTPPILTPPVDPLSPQLHASARWEEHAAGYSAISQAAQQPYSPTSDPSTSRSSVTPSSSSSKPPAKEPSIAFPTPLGRHLLSVDIESSIPSSPDSFRSAHSIFSSDDSDVPTESLPLLSSSQQSTSTVKATTPQRPDEMPCAKCIHKCALVASAVVQGNLGVQVTCEREACNRSALAVSINAMVAKLSNFTQEVIQVAAQGAEGELGVQANIMHEHGVWKEFVQYLNTMTSSYMEQVLDIANVCTSVADGDLSKKITVAAKGQTLGLKETINTMGKLFFFFFFAVSVTRGGLCVCVSVCFYSRRLVLLCMQPLFYLGKMTCRVLGSFKRLQGERALY